MPFFITTCRKKYLKFKRRASPVIETKCISCRWGYGDHLLLVPGLILQYLVPTQNHVLKIGNYYHCIVNAKEKALSQVCNKV